MKPIHPADAAELAKVPHATSFIASLFVGTGRYEKAEAPTLEAARAEAKRLTAQHQVGRIAVVYAIMPDGKQALVPNSYQPPVAGGSDLSAAMQALNIKPKSEEAMPAKTFDKRFNAQRAARSALKNPKAEEGKEFTTSKSAGGWAFAITLDGLAHTDAGKANAESWNAVLPKRAAAAKAKAEKKASKPVKATKPAKAPKGDKAAKVGKRAAIIEAAQAGKLPPVPDFSAPTHARFRGRLDEVIALVKAGDVKGLKAYPINPISSSPKAIDRYRNLAVIALQARTHA